MNMIDADYIANRISDLRIKKNVSARDMSLSIGQSQSYINNIENKKALPSMQMFLYICEYLEISPKDFFDEEINSPDAFNELIQSFKRLNKEQIDILLAVAEEMK